MAEQQQEDVDAENKWAGLTFHHGKRLRPPCAFAVQKKTEQLKRKSGNRVFTLAGRGGVGSNVSSFHRLTFDPCQAVPPISIPSIPSPAVLATGLKAFKDH